MRSGILSLLGNKLVVQRIQEMRCCSAWKRSILI